MGIATAKRSRKSTVQKKKIVKAKDHSADPFFVKKAKVAEAYLKKNGLPVELTK